MPDIFPQVIDRLLRDPFPLMVAVAGAFSLMTGLLGAWIGAYFGGRRGARREIARAAATTASPALADAQLAELRHAVETMALEMERISEGQRFTARMLLERMPAARVPVHPRRDAGPITPH